MFARLFAVASLAALAVAGPAPLIVRDQCNTGSINCCNRVYQAHEINNLLGIFGVNGPR
ncbi:hypothetical protein L210DRAFT_3652552 [Boletus edulis BED1]|uniref:Hydrophobin n=1 Tax=Boletus edulis BED1 TaxID=1328754 RepID=A0AAD4BGN8_BOLED|nr:hypothetical protein L210DRAFT_3652552 [Boletus edulis BED1]